MTPFNTQPVISLKQAKSWAEEASQIAYDLIDTAEDLKKTKPWNRDRETNLARQAFNGAIRNLEALLSEMREAAQ